MVYFIYKVMKTYEKVSKGKQNEHKNIDFLNFVHKNVKFSPKISITTTTLVSTH